MMDKAWMFLIGTMVVMFVPLFISGMIHRIEPIIVSFVGTPIVLFVGMRYEKRINGSVEQ